MLVESFTSMSWLYYQSSQVCMRIHFDCPFWWCLRTCYSLPAHAMTASLGARGEHSVMNWSLCVAWDWIHPSIEYSTYAASLEDYHFGIGTKFVNSSVGCVCVGTITCSLVVGSAAMIDKITRLGRVIGLICLSSASETCHLSLVVCLSSWRSAHLCDLGSCWCVRHVSAT